MSPKYFTLIGRVTGASRVFDERPNMSVSRDGVSRGSLVP